MCVVYNQHLSSVWKDPFKNALSHLDSTAANSSHILVIRGPQETNWSSCLSNLCYKWPVNSRGRKLENTINFHPLPATIFPLPFLNHNTHWVWPCGFLMNYICEDLLDVLNILLYCVTFFLFVICLPPHLQLLLVYCTPDCLRREGLSLEEFPPLCSQRAWAGSGPHNVRACEAL